MSARFGSSSRASSVAVDTSFASQQRIQRGQAMSPTINKRWSSANEYSYTNDRQSMIREGSEFRSRGRTPNVPTYTDALIKCSQRLRERSLSPPPNVTHEKVSPYHCNMDYYRGKVKSVYEKEPYFKDFVRNIPLSESNMYDMNNLTRLKRRFNNIVMDKWGGRDSTPDPFKPSRNATEIYEPVADKLAIKHKSVPYLPTPLPYIYVYHRSTRH